MKSPLHSTRLLLATGLLLMAAGPASAQLAEGLDSPAPKSATPGTGDGEPKPAAAPAAEAGEKIVASRFVGAEVAAYVRELSGKLSIRSRTTDPFGRYQDPNHVVPEPKIVSRSPLQGFKAEPPMPFSEVIAGISVNTVIPAKQIFLIGNREFRVGQAFPLKLPSGKEIQVQVVTVTSARIRFKNVATAETADLELNMLPSGMQRGTGGINAPGMEADDESAPVEIQPVIPLSTNR